MLVSIRSCAYGATFRLTYGLAISAIAGLAQGLLFSAGAWLGRMVRYSSTVFEQTNNLIFVGLTILVAVRWLLQVRRKDAALPSYDIASWRGATLFALAQGMTAFFLGLGYGVWAVRSSLGMCLVLVSIMVMIASYLGIMFGRRRVDMRVRRWQFLSAMLLIGSALAIVLM